MQKTIFRYGSQVRTTVKVIPTYMYLLFYFHQRKKKIPKTYPWWSRKTCRVLAFLSHHPTFSLWWAPSSSAWWRSLLFLRSKYHLITNNKVTNKMLQLPYTEDIDIDVDNRNKHRGRYLLVTDYVKSSVYDSHLLVCGSSDPDPIPHFSPIGSGSGSRLRIQVPICFAEWHHTTSFSILNWDPHLSMRIHIQVTFLSAEPCGSGSEKLVDKMEGKNLIKDQFSWENVMLEKKVIHLEI